METNKERRAESIPGFNEFVAWAMLRARRQWGRDEPMKRIVLTYEGFKIVIEPPRSQRGGSQPEGRNAG